MTKHRINSPAASSSRQERGAAERKEGEGERECGGTDEDIKGQRAGRQEHTGRQVCSSNVLLAAVRQSHGDNIWQEQEGAAGASVGQSDR